VDELEHFGYVHGRNLSIQSRWTEGVVDALEAHAKDLAGRNVDLILTWGTPATLAAKKATGRIPIVMVGVGEPVQSGLVSTLSRPGGNVTGVSNLARDLNEKVLGLLKEILPSAGRFGVVRNPANPVHAFFLTETQAAARGLKLDLYVLDASTPEHLDSAFATLTRERLAGVTFLAEPLVVSQCKRIADLALRARVPTAFPGRECVEAGGLVSYGPTLFAQFARAAGHADRIFKGQKPGELPVEPSTTFEVLVNMKTARAIGVTIPGSLLLRADQVIE
jgi:putative ABC transport system substrate-binding protein